MKSCFKNPIGPFGSTPIAKGFWTGGKPRARRSWLAQLATLSLCSGELPRMLECDTQQIALDELLNQTVSGLPSVCRPFGER
jgi:hypothetical protein